MLFVVCDELAVSVVVEGGAVGAIASGSKVNIR